MQGNGFGEGGNSSLPCLSTSGAVSNQWESAATLLSAPRRVSPFPSTEDGGLLPCSSAPHLHDGVAPENYSPRTDDHHILRTTDQIRPEPMNLYSTPHSSSRDGYYSVHVSGGKQRDSSTSSGKPEILLGPESANRAVYRAISPHPDDESFASSLASQRRKAALRRRDTRLSDFWDDGNDAEGFSTSARVSDDPASGVDPQGSSHEARSDTPWCPDLGPSAACMIPDRLLSASSLPLAPVRRSNSLHKTGASRIGKLPAALEERYRVVRKLGSGVYGDVYVCSFIGNEKRLSQASSGTWGRREEALTGFIGSRTVDGTVCGGTEFELSRGAEGRPLFAIKRVRLPTSKLKSLFGMEQQVLRELTVLRGLNHVNILKLEAFYFEMEPWDRSSLFRAAVKRVTEAVLRETRRSANPRNPESRRESKDGSKIVAEGLAAVQSHLGDAASADLPSFKDAIARADRLRHSDKEIRRIQDQAVAAHEAALKKKLKPDQLLRPTIYMIFELCDCDLAKFIDMRYKNFLEFWRLASQEIQIGEGGLRRQPLLSGNVPSDTPPLPGVTEAETQLIAYQLFQALAYCHSHGVLHRDVKPQNILMMRDVDSEGTEHWVVKLGDFGLACCTHTADPSRTGEVVTLLYRAPELLLGRTDYGGAVDVWSMAIVIIEIVVGHPPFKARNEVDMLARIAQCVGSSNAQELREIAPNPAALEAALPLILKEADQPKLKSLLTDRFGRQLLSDQGLDLLTRLLEVNPAKRLTAVAALQHPWLQPVLDRFPNKEVYIQPLSKLQLPTSFLAVDPLSHNFYFLQRQLKSRTDAAREKQSSPRVSASLSFSNKSQNQAELKVSDLCSNAYSTLSTNDSENKRTWNSLRLLMPWDEAPLPRNLFGVRPNPHMLTEIIPTMVASIYSRCGLGKSRATPCQ
uniref:CMGC kinase n=1 Tax=Toxoplasma gondii COUG TaxID=1074873 RepID=A0A2G8Y8I1_TOXGO|nr:CMGC kinase [Toxoplasma gondii COUG]